MPRTLEVEIDESGAIHPLDANVKLPAGRATLVWGSVGDELYLMSEQALARDWLRPEEDEAWAYLRQDKL
jgi:hypothetical protein